MAAARTQSGLLTAMDSVEMIGQAGETAAPGAEHAVTADSVAGVVAVEPRLFQAGFGQLVQPLGGAFPQLVERAELDRLGRAGLGAGGLQTGAQ